MADARLDAFFAARGWRVFPFQREAWDAFLAGESGLVHAPTGTGKTLAVWGGPMLEAMRRGNEKRKGKARTLRVLWITPLRALAADTQENLAEVVRELGLDWITLRRTGDSRSTERAKVKRGECDALITTPESLALLLSYDDSVERFAALDAVVVDEWHELMGTKRGVLLELALARLRTLAPRMRTWGLSATLGNLEQARDVLDSPLWSVAPHAEARGSHHRHARDCPAARDDERRSLTDSRARGAGGILAIRARSSTCPQRRGEQTARLMESRHGDGSTVRSSSW